MPNVFSMVLRDRLRSETVFYLVILPSPVDHDSVKAGGRSPR